MSSTFELDGFIPYQVAVLAGRLGREFSHTYQERYGLSRSEWRVLVLLSGEGAVSVREIHARVDMDKSKVSRAATRLEEVGAITKRVSKADRRLVDLSLTPKGVAMIRDLAPLAQKFQSDLRERLGEDADAFLRGMERLADLDDI